MLTLKIHITEKKRSFTSKKGNDVTLTECYVFLPSSPYPEKLDLFDVRAPAGVYNCTANLVNQNNRLSVEFDLKTLKQVEK